MHSQELYNQAVEASKLYALKSTGNGYELTVTAERFWDDTTNELTISYNQNLKPVGYSLTHCKQSKISLTGNGAELIEEREVYSKVDYKFH